MYVELLKFTMTCYKEIIYRFAFETPLKKERNREGLLDLNKEYQHLFYTDNVNLFCEKINAIQKRHTLF